MQNILKKQENYFDTPKGIRKEDIDLTQRAWIEVHGKAIDHDMEYINSCSRKLFFDESLMTRLNPDGCHNPHLLAL